MSIRSTFQTLTPCRNVKEAFLVFLALALTAFLNVGQLWDHHTMVTCYPNLDLMETLELEAHQTQQIEAIQREYEAKVFRLGRIDSDSKNEKVSYLVRERNHRIIEVLSDHQQKMLNTYCTDLITLTDY